METPFLNIINSINRLFYRIFTNIDTSKSIYSQYEPFWTEFNKLNIELNRQDIGMINEKVLLLHELRNYYQELIVHHKDVLLITNKNSCLFQVKILNKQKIIYEDEEYRNTSGYDQTRHNKDDSTILYIDVYLEDDTYYYGNCYGVRIHTLKSNCELLERPIESEPLEYLIINNKLIQQLLLTDKKCNFILFENIMSIPAIYEIYVLPSISIDDDPDNADVRMILQQDDIIHLFLK